MVSYKQNPTYYTHTNNNRFNEAKKLSNKNKNKKLGMN